MTKTHRSFFRVMLPRLSLIATTMLLGWGVASLFAAEKYLEQSKFDAIALLAPPPLPDSPEQAADLASIRAVFNARTPEEKARADQSARLSIFLFAPAIGPSFQPGRYPKVETLMQNVKDSVGGIIDQPKNHWKRLRPYLVDPSLQLGKPERSPSYPSGHSTRGTVEALVLAEVFPEQREAILAIGRSIGWDRVLIGKHYPTDIHAGRVLGKNLYNELMKTPAFQRDLAAAKAEVQAAQK
ncbi:MAG: phosphatase PAP2 family protein [Opitutae bacterium]|nr:phosphatase PAP2 family protein [Opitutae bacterium]